MNKHTLRFDTVQGPRAHPSLFPLRMILFAAELETPTQPPHASPTADELLALTLIERIKRPPTPSLINWQIEAPQPLHSASFLELADVHA